MSGYETYTSLREGEGIQRVLKADEKILNEIKPKSLDIVSETIKGNPFRRVEDICFTGERILVKYSKEVFSISYNDIGGIRDANIDFITVGNIFALFICFFGFVSLSAFLIMFIFIARIQQIWFFALVIGWLISIYSISIPYKILTKSSKLKCVEIVPKDVNQSMSWILQRNIKFAGSQESIKELVDSVNARIK